MTVGTHEQPFDRLLREIDRLVATGALQEEVFCQTGYSTYRPAVPSAPMVGYETMLGHIEAASVVVTHGGPGSVLPALMAGRRVVLAPRRRRYGEHVDDHQVAFCRRVAAERGLPVVLEMEELGGAIAAALAGPPPAAVAGAGPRRGVEALERRIAAALAARRRP